MPSKDIDLNNLNFLKLFKNFNSGAEGIKMKVERTKTMNRKLLHKVNWESLFTKKYGKSSAGL